MSMLRSPKKACGGSHPDLSKLKDNDNLIDKPQITLRKRKEPEADSFMKQEFESFRNEMRSFLTSFSKIQSENTIKMQQDMKEIKDQLDGIKASTDKVMEEQNKLKIELESLKVRCTKNENSIKCLQNDILSTKSLPTLSQTLEYENLLTELQDRTQRQKNIVLIGVPEPAVENKGSRDKHDSTEVLKIIQSLHQSCPAPIKMFRLGKYSPEKNRPIKVCFESEKTVITLLRNKSNVRDNIKIYPDQTYQQRSYLKHLREDLLQRQANGEKNLSIKYIKGTPKIITLQSKN